MRVTLLTACHSVPYSVTLPAILILGFEADTTRCQICVFAFFGRMSAQDESNGLDRALPRERLTNVCLSWPMAAPTVFRPRVFSESSLIFEVQSGRVPRSPHENP